MPKRVEWTLPVKCKASISILMDEDEGAPDVAEMMASIQRAFDNTGGLDALTGAVFYACAFEPAGQLGVTHEGEDA